MKYFLVIAFLFIMGSTIGWVIELLFRRFFSAHKWINPGFLVGPYLPLYGFGLCALFGLASIDISFITTTYWLQVVIKVAVMTFAMTLVEYIAGLIFIKGMNIKLWDYSNRPGNIQGIICPLFTFFWAVIALIYVLFIHNVVEGWVNWFDNNIIFSFFVGIVLGAMIVDFAYSINLASKIKRYAKEMQIVVHYEHFKDYITTKVKSSKLKNALVPLMKPLNVLKENIQSYKDAMKTNKTNKEKKE